MFPEPLYSEPAIQEHVHWGVEMYVCVCFNPFHATALFLYPLKMSENPWLSNFYRGFRKIAVPVGITCSKLTIETLEQGVKYVQS